MELSKNIVSYVGGLPLALEVLGSSLFERPMVEWESVYGKMKEIPHKDIQKKLRISYDALDDDKVRDIFLDIAFFLIGMDKDDAIRILDACGFFPNIGISILRERCLLTIDRENKLRMHNLIRDMGREIVREESIKNPRMRSRLWFHKDAYDVLKNFKGRVHENIEGIRLGMPMQERVDISTRAFHSLPNLRLLHINNVNLTGSFEKSFEELRWLRWNDCSLDCLPSSFQAPKLVSLDMQDSKVKILWKGTKQLQSLKILNASGSLFLKTTPDFKGLESLEKLILRGCSSLSRIHPSIGLLHKLVDLDLSGDYRVIRKVGLNQLNQLPGQLGDMGCLRKLDASWSSIEQLPDSIGNLGKLEVLNLFRCEKLRNLPSSICGLTSLTYLCLGFCSNLESLPKNFGNLTSLTSLRLDYCSNLESLPKNFGNLTSLTDLDLSDSSIMQLPYSIGCCLTRLETLLANDCKRLRNTPRSIYNLSSLKSLSLFDCSENVVSLSLLEYLWLSNEYLNSLPSNLSQLVNLRELVVYRCSSLQSLPELPPNLKYLFADGCTSLDKLPNLSRMNNLRTLEFTECSNLQSLPELPPNLEELDASCCTSLDKLPNLSRMNNLWRLKFTECSSLQSLPELPPNLKELDADGCTSLDKLPNLSRMNNLRRLKFTECISLQSLPELPPNLKDLDADGCTSLDKLPNLSRMNNLIRLKFRKCSSLQSLPKLPLSLESLELQNCTSLRSLPELPPVLNLLYLKNCSSLESFPDLPLSLEFLELPNGSKFVVLEKLL